MPNVYDLDIVIVNWNSGSQLRACLQSMATVAIRGFSLGTVIVVDNGSSDGSAVEIDIQGLPVVWVHNRSNVGFAKACNQGAAYGRSGVILFLNPDVRLFENSLKKPLQFLAADRASAVGIVGIQLVDGQGTVARSCARFPGVRSLIAQSVGLDRILPGSFHGHFLSGWNHGQTRQVDQVMGAFFMVRRHVFEKLDGFDERFFVYYEDLDFSLRARSAGYSSWYLAEAAAYHRGCGTSDRARAERLYYFLKSRILYGSKHFGKLPGLVLMFLVLAGELPLRIIGSAVMLPADQARDTLKGAARLYRKVPEMLRGVRKSGYGV